MRLWRHTLSLKNLMGQTAFDRYLLGGESDRWDLPKKKEKELERIRDKGKGTSAEEAGTPANENEAEGGGLRDDALPTSAEQIEPAEDAEGEEGEMEEDDEVTKAAKDATKQLQMETDNQDD